MDLDWKDVAEVVADAAPLVGTALFGPAGGAVGAGLSALFGSKPEPAALAEAIKADPDAVMKLKKYELEQQTALQTAVITADTARIVAVNQTMQGEAKAEHWPQYSWRPFWGFVSALAFLAVVIFACMMAFDALKKGDATYLNAIPQMVASFSTLFAIPAAILGVASWHRGKEKRLRAGEGAAAPLLQSGGLFQKIFK